ncbi:restriction endonuclease subunit S [Bacillus toyonensis]|nr:restriction endonuclease subunit S [Bacillus toyonensis]
MFENTHSYFKFPSEVNNRLDVTFNDSLLDEIYTKIEQSKYPFLELGDVVNFIKDSRNPTHIPDEEFDYVEIGKIDTVKGKVNSIKMLGKEATSSRVRRIMYRNHVIVSTTRPTRKAIAIVPPKLDGQICSTGLAVLRPKEGISAEFLFFALRTNISKAQFEKYCTGSGYPAINQEKDLPKIKIPNPEVIEQDRILSIVKPIQVKALRLEVLAKRATQEAKNFFEGIFSIDYPQADSENYFHLSGSSKKTVSFFKPIETIGNRLNYLSYNTKLQVIDQLKAKFNMIELKNAVEEKIFRGNQPIYDENGDFKVIKTVDIQEDRIKLDECLTVSEEFFNDNEAYHVKKGDILIASTGIGSMGKVAIYEEETPALCDSHISIVRLKESFDTSFIAHYLRSHFGQVQIEQFFTGSSGQIELQVGDIGKIIIPNNDENGISYHDQVKLAIEMNEKFNTSYNLNWAAIRKWIEAENTFEQLVLERPES